MFSTSLAFELGILIILNSGPRSLLEEGYLRMLQRKEMGHF